MSLAGHFSVKDGEHELARIELQVVNNPADEVDAQDVPLISDDRDLQFGTSEGGGTSGNGFIWILTAAASVSGLLFGYDTGVISSTLVSIGSDLSGRQLTTLDKGMITSSTSLFAMIASPAAGALADKWGRKKIVLVADGLFTLGALWQAVTTTVWGMIFGRSIVGLAIGGASLIVPLYISELAPTDMRGRLVTTSIAFVTGGQVVAYLVGWAFSHTTHGWRWMVGLGAFPAITQFCVLAYMPETPRWLVKAMDANDKARAVLRKVYGSNTKAVEYVLQAIQCEVLEEQAILKIRSTSSRRCMGPVLSSLFLYPPHLRALTIACLLQGLQQLCGFNSLMYFSATIFDMLHFSSPTLTSLTVAVTNFMFSLVAFMLIDRIGRRRILLLTIPIMVLGLLLCAFAFSFVSILASSSHSGFSTAAPRAPRFPAIAILLSLVLYVSSYAVGMGSVPWQQSELFPLDVRSLGSSISTATNWGCNFTVGLTFLPMMERLTPEWTFVTYAMVCAFGWVTVYRIYPETTGLALEDVGALLKDNWGVNESLERMKKQKGQANLGAEVYRERIDS